MTMKADAIAAYDRIAWGKTVAGTEAMVHDLAKIHAALQSIPTDRAVQWACSQCGTHYSGMHECTVTVDLKTYQEPTMWTGPLRGWVGRKKAENTPRADKNLSEPSYWEGQEETFAPAEDPPLESHGKVLGMWVQYDSLHKLIRIQTHYEDGYVHTENDVDPLDPRLRERHPSLASWKLDDMFYEREDARARGENPQ